MYIDIALCDLAAAELFHQLAGAVHCSQRIIGIQSLFKNCRSLRAKADPLGGLADVRAVEGCRLEQNGVHVLRDHGVLTAHDAGDADRTLCIVDHQNVVIQLSFLIVQCGKGIPVRCAFHNDLSAVNGVEIIGVHRLAVFHHDEIRDVDQIVDRTDSVIGKSALHPAGARCQLDIGADGCHIPAAKICILD